MNASKPIWANSAEKLSFGGIQFALSIFMAFSSYYLMMFFTDVALIPLGATAALLLFHRLFSVVSGQAVGLFINRISFSDGKYRPYFKWLTIPFALSLIALGLVPGISPTYQIAYAAMVLVSCELGWLFLHTASFSMLPYLALDDVSRTKFVSFANSSAILAFIIVGTFTLPLTDFLGGDDRSKGFALALALFALLATPLCLNGYFSLRERYFGDFSEKRNIKDLYLTLIHNKRFMLYLSGYFLYSVADGFKNLMTYYYMTYNMGRPDLVPFIILAGLIAPLAAQPVIPRLLYFARKEQLMVTGLFAASGASLLMLAAGQNPYILICCAVLYGFSTAVVANLVFALMASFSDEMRKKNLSMSEILTATLDLSYTIGIAIASGIAPLVMAAMGYSAQLAIQTPEALIGIKGLYILGTASVMALSGIVFYLLYRKSISR